MGFSMTLSAPSSRCLPAASRLLSGFHLNWTEGFTWCTATAVPALSRQAQSHPGLCDWTLSAQGLQAKLHGWDDQVPGTRPLLAFRDWEGHNPGGGWGREVGDAGAVTTTPLPSYITIRGQSICHTYKHFRAVFCSLPNLQAAKNSCMTGCGCYVTVTCDTAR